MGRVGFQKRLFILLITCFFKFYYAQNINILYELNYKAKQNSDSISNEKMLLEIDINNKTSLYQSYNKIKNDSIVTEINNLGNFKELNSMINSLPQFSFYNKIFKNPSQDKFIVLEYINGKYYSTNYYFPSNWKLSEGNKIIQKYKCNKASINFGGRDWVAWYAVEIPFQNGPDKFYGLPGLILEIYSEDGDYKFSTIEIKNGDREITQPKSIKFSNGQLKKLKKKTAEDPSSILGKEFLNINSSNLRTDIKFDGQEVKKSNLDLFKSINKEIWDWMKKHNNPLERDDIWLK